MERIRTPELQPLEIWDLMVEGKLLGEQTCSPDFPETLRTALVSIHSGGASTRTHGPLPAFAAGFEAVWLAGGRSGEPGLMEATRGLPFPVLTSPEGVFVGTAGGFDFLRARGLEGWVADLGQSHFKLAAPTRRWNFPRDWTRLRPKVEVLPAEHAAHRRRLREFLALKLLAALAEHPGRPPALVFALPTRIHEDGTPGGSSYAGMRGDRALLPDALAMAGLRESRLFVLNDAELAALSARLDPGLAAWRKVLVLTVGFGLGAALLHRTGGRDASHAGPARAVINGSAGSSPR